MAEHVIEVKVSELPEVVQHIKRLEGERDAARKSESEAVALLRKLVESVDVIGPDSSEEREAQEQAQLAAIRKARAYLARRKEQPHA